MRDKQGGDDPSVPVTPEVAVQSDGWLRRPAQEAARPAAPVASADATTGLEAALSARAAHIILPPPRTYVLLPLGSPAPVTPHTPPTYLSAAPPHQSSAHLQAPGVPSDTSQGGLRLLCSAVPANPAGFRPDGAFPLGTDVTLRRPANGRGAPPAPVPGATREVTHVQP